MRSFKNCLASRNNHFIKINKRSLPEFYGVCNRKTNMGVKLRCKYTNESGFVSTGFSYKAVDSIVRDEKEELKDIISSGILD